ncbi:MAG: hypothetical protein Q8941_03805 [Bacteroidota bacterium]|nr:hypothetical protein [Bacteroidota bacterium]
MSNDQPQKLSRNLSEKFRDFLIQHPPSGFSRHLRGLLMDYMIAQQMQGFPLDFHICIWELSDFFELLDCAADEWGDQKEP